MTAFENAKLKALKVLIQSDCILNDDQVKTIATAMSLLSEYSGGYTLFGEQLENASLSDCTDVLQTHYQSKRTNDDRRNAGRYYTPIHLTRATTKRTLDPVLPETLKKVAALPVEQQLAEMLKFSTCDPACGSGVFLSVAAKQIGVEVARIAFQAKQLTAKQVEFGMLLASQNCIYGVDKDPLAIELCKLSLWLNATQQHLLTDLPLPSLTNIRCGDSLVGVNDLTVLQHGIPDGFYKTSGSLDDKSTAAELRKRNKQERSRFKITSKSASLATLRTACNVWSSVCFIPKAPDFLVPTTYTLQCVLNGAVPSDQQAIVEHANEVAKRLKFFHWKLEFPEVFLIPKHQ
jgi:hypothetical protein